MLLEDLLPPRPDGTKAFLPTQTEVIESDAKYIALVGGVGSSKTTVVAVLGVAFSLYVPGNRGIVIRRSYSKLHDSTEQVFLEVLERAGIEGIRYMQHRDGFPHRVVLPNASEILFRESKDLGRFLGPEYGWFYVDEAQEEPWETFKGLMERLRLPRAKKYLKGFIATNPPHKTHWIAKTFGLKPGVKSITEPTTGVTTKYQLIRSSTRDNTNLPVGYLADILANNPDAEISRVVDGHFGFAQDGEPVYPQYKERIHQGELKLKPFTPIIRGWDFGFHHPAVTWHQIWRCRFRSIHWSILHELDLSNVESEVLAQEAFNESCRMFPEAAPALFLDAGDRAGAQVSEKGPGPIIRLAGPPFHLQVKHKWCPIEPGLELIRKMLSFQCRCGLPGLMVDRSCISVNDGFLGGYHYPKKTGQTSKEVPYKDKYYDDFMDSIRYVAENYVRQELLGEGFLSQLMATEDTIMSMDYQDGGGKHEWMTRGVSSRDWNR